MEASGFGGPAGGDAGGEGFAGDAGGVFDGGDGGEFYDDGQGYDYGGYDNGPAADPQQTAATLQGLIGNAVQQHVGPLQEQLGAMEMERGATQLVSQYPELGEPENAERLIGTARQVAQQLGMPELANRPQFWGLIHGAMQQSDAAQQREREPQGDDGDYFGVGGAKLPF